MFLTRPTLCLLTLFFVFMQSACDQGTLFSSKANINEKPGSDAQTDAIDGENGAAKDGAKANGDDGSVLGKNDNSNANGNGSHADEHDASTLGDATGQNTTGKNGGQSGSGGGGDATSVGSDEVPFEPKITSSSTTTADSRQFSFGAPLSTTRFGGAVWTVSKDGVVTKITVDKEAQYPKQTWTIDNASSGHRTFVSEIGLLIAKTGGKLYRVDDRTMTDSGELLHAFPAHKDSRLCVTSFLVSGESYIGVAYHNGSDFVFSRFPIDRKKEKSVDFTRMDTFTKTSSNLGKGGYSCFIDHGRGYFWVGSKSDKNEAIWGVDVHTGAFLSTQSIPNSDHNIQIEGVELSFPNKQSYAISGDRSGKVFNVKSAYTFAGLSDIVIDTITQKTVRKSYAIGRIGSKLLVIDTRCFDKVPDLSNEQLSTYCDNKHAWIPFDSMGSIGPVSTMADGRSIAAISRNGGGEKDHSSVYIIKLKNFNDVTEGVQVEKIAEVSGDAYMYTDFTGGMLYASTDYVKIDLRNIEGFKSETALRDLNITLLSESGKMEPYEGIDLAIRCYNDGSESKLSRINNILITQEEVLITEPTCQNKAFNFIEVRITASLNSGVFTKTKSIHFTFLQ